MFTPFISSSCLYGESDEMKLGAHKSTERFGKNTVKLFHGEYCRLSTKCTAMCQTSHIKVRVDPCCCTPKFKIIFMSMTSKCLYEIPQILLYMQPMWTHET
ncbi:hypothetical protein QQ045_005938 [Rhodiola kirilowii]